MESVIQNSAEKLKEIDAEIEKQIRKVITPDNPNIGVMPDGILDFKKYSDAKFKILWILKEPYADFDEKGNPNNGGWHIRDGLIRLKKYSDFTDGKKTFKPMIYTTWGILNDFCQYEDMKDVEDEPTMIDALKSIAYINVKKLPGRTTSNPSEIENAYAQHHEILHKQISEYNPDIIICGGTLYHFMNRLGIKREELINLGSVNYIIKEKKIYIEAYHPAQRKSSTNVSQKEYCNDIINAVKVWNSQVNLQ